jgi:hypothetical protein
MMAQLAESGHLTMDDVRALEATIRRVEQQKRAERKKR